MTKKFCDICGKPALEDIRPQVHTINYDVPHERADGMSSGGFSKKVQPKIAVEARFCFRDHKTGFGGPPDLCESCILDLLEGLYEQAKKPKARAVKSK